MYFDLLINKKECPEKGINALPMSQLSAPTIPEANPREEGLKHLP